MSSMDGNPCNTADIGLQPSSSNTENHPALLTKLRKHSDSSDDAASADTDEEYDRCLAEVHHDSVEVEEDCEDVGLTGDLRSILSPLRGLCTYDLLHKARIRKYGQLYSCQRRWESRDEELLALDRAAHVPNDTKETREVADVMERFVHRLLKKLSQTNHEELGLLKFSLLPIGSFPCNTKVGDIDEFDYVLLHKSIGRLINGIASQRNDPFLAYGDIGDIVETVEKLLPLIRAYLKGLNLPDRHCVSVSDIYLHGPAMCVQLAWVCADHNHEHTIGIDLSIGCYAPGNRAVEFLRGLAEKHPKNKLVKVLLRKISTKEPLVVINKSFNWIPSTCNIDPTVHACLSELSDTINPLFRLMKLCLCNSLPVGLLLSKSSMHGFRHCSCVDSHALKMCLLRKVLLQPEEPNWTKEMAALNLGEMLKKLINLKEGGSLFYEFEEFYYPRRMKRGNNGANAIDTGIEHISRGLDANQEQLPMEIVELPPDVILVYVDRHRRYNHGTSHVHLCRVKKELVSPGVITFVSPAPLPDMPYSRFSFIRYCHGFIHVLYKHSPGIDLSVIPKDKLAKVWALYERQTLKPVEGVDPDVIERLQERL